MVIGQHMQEEWFSLGGAPTRIGWLLTGEGWVTKGYSWGCTSKSQTDRELTKMIFLPEGVLWFNLIRNSFRESTTSKESNMILQHTSPF